jgi:hypothetical protein
MLWRSFNRLLFAAISCLSLWLFLEFDSPASAGFFLGLFWTLSGVQAMGIPLSFILGIAKKIEDQNATR